MDRTEMDAWTDHWYDVDRHDEHCDLSRSQQDQSPQITLPPKELVEIVVAYHRELK